MLFCCAGCWPSPGSAPGLTLDTRTLKADVPHGVFLAKPRGTDDGKATRGAEEHPFLGASVEQEEQAKHRTCRAANEVPTHLICSSPFPLCCWTHLSAHPSETHPVSHCFSNVQPWAQPMHMHPVAANIVSHGCAGISAQREKQRAASIYDGDDLAGG